jgi:hypothetical protein
VQAQRAILGGQQRPRVAQLTPGEAIFEIEGLPGRRHGSSSGR